jgi:hypothetical protein
MNLMVITQRDRPGINIPGVIEANDLTPDMAIAIAKVWKQTVPDYQWCEADIKRFDGLTLKSTKGVELHFGSTLCGYNGDAVMATATILELFGFGTYRTIMFEISYADNAAHLTLSHPTLMLEEAYQTI